ncbi:hypothetical protein [Umezawaea sp. Da 62-37]|uniref:hypothetical protein n=1 Tax=Umezawaea sp. Da 62-37 TaxID=3075927 RepID=UPI0028F74F85|nr:hypothetical protein [Umezawaea sp. Da 62-37]WNV90796.1 hypothetical protein RM788_21700 [Umezawaea sp. Da 62-37]
MWKNRVVAGLVGVGAVLALAVGSATVANGSTPAADTPGRVDVPAEDGPAAVALAHGEGVVLANDGWWYVHGGPFEFSVTATAARTGQVEQAALFIVWPGEFSLVETAGDRWTCGAVANGVECTNPAPVAPGESWPALTLGVNATGAVQDSIDVYLSGAGGSDAHASTPIMFDTSS